MRLVDDMRTQASKLESRASGFRMTGETGKAREYTMAVIALRDAADKLERIV